LSSPVDANQYLRHRFGSLKYLILVNCISCYLIPNTYIKSLEADHASTKFRSLLRMYTLNKRRKFRRVIFHSIMISISYSYNVYVNALKLLFGASSIRELYPWKKLRIRLQLHYNIIMNALCTLWTTFV